MVEATLVLSIFDKCLNIFGLVRDGKLQREKQVDDGLHALFKALCETKAYVSRLNDGEKRDRRHESDIAHLWHEASVPLRHIDPELAHRCFYKGSFWHEPDSWTAVQLRESKIALDQVCKSAEELLTKGKPNN